MCVDVLWMSKFNDIFQFFEKLKSFDNFEDSLSSCLFLRTEMDPSKEEKTCDGCDKVVKEEVQYANQTFCGDCFRKKINKLPLPKEIAKQEKGKKGSKPKKVALCSYADLQRHGKILGRVGWRSVAVFCVRGKLCCCVFSLLLLLLLLLLTFGSHRKGVCSGQLVLSCWWTLD